MGFIDDLTGGTATAQAPASSGFVHDLTAPAAAPATAPEDLFKGIPKTLDTSGSTIASNLQGSIAPAKPVDTSSAFSKFIGLNGLTRQTPVTSGVTTPGLATGQQESPDNSAAGTLKNTLAGLPAAAKKVSGAINDTLIKKPADLLANTDFIKQAAAGTDAGSVSGNFAQEMLQKLSRGLEGVSGATGGAYQTPEQQAQGAANDKANQSAAAVDPAKQKAIDDGSKELDALKAQIDEAQKQVDPTNQASIDAFNKMVEDYNTKATALQSEVDDFNGTVGTAQSDAAKAQALQGDWLDKTLSSISQAIGFGAAITSIGGIATSGSRAQAAITGLSGMAEKFPLVGKYMAPYVEQFISMAAGSAAVSQFDPKLAADYKQRVKTLGVAIGTAPVYTALGAIKSAGVSLPASFTLGFVSAKLSGASNSDALRSGLAFTLLDVFGRAGENRGFTVEEIAQKNHNDALQVLQPYSKVKLTANSSPEELKAAWLKAAHQTHPDVGGTAEAFSKAKNAYDFLSKGAISKAKGATPAEESVKALSGEIKDISTEHGVEVAHHALTEHLGVDNATAARLVEAANKPAEVPKPIDTRTDAAITADAIAHVDKNLPDLVQKYVKEFGNVVGADEAKELIPGYSNDRSTSDLVQKAAAKISDTTYDHLLETKQGTGNNVVLITAGGTGAGKSTSIKELNTKDYPVVFDTNLSNAKGGIMRIQKALDAGFLVDLRFTYTRPDKAYDRVLDRSEQMARRQGSGRPVSAQGHLDMHYGSHDALPEIIKHFEQEIKDGKMFVDLYDNSGVTAIKADNALDFINNVRDNNKNNETDRHAQLIEQRRLAHHEGRISDQTNKGFDRAETLRPRKTEPAVSHGFQESSKEPSGDTLTESTKAIHDIYAAKDNAAEELHYMLAELLELSEPGFRGFNEDGSVFAVNSTFPDWLPEELRDKDLFTKVFGKMETVTDLKYPSNPRAFKQRQLFDHVLAALDYRLGVDTSAERSAILSTYGEESESGQTSAPTQESISEANDSGAQGSQGAEEEIAARPDERPEIYYHGTSAENAQSILKNGFKDDTADIGNAVALTDDPSEAQEYANHYGKDGVVMQVRLKKDAGEPDYFKNNPSSREPLFRTQDARPVGIQPKGMINVGAIVDSADAHVKDFIEKTMVPVALSENLGDSFAKLEGAAQADLETVNKIIKDLPITAADDEALYYAAEDPEHPLTAAQRELKEKFDTPFQKINQALFERIKNDGTPLPDEGTYIARFPKERPSIMQRIFNPGERGATTKQGSILSKTTSSFKKRTMKALVDSEGNRTVVAIKDGKVTAFNNKVSTELGSLNKKVTTKVKEFFDPEVRGKLEQLARDLGVTHLRVPTGKSLGLGGNRAGVSFQGEDLIKTRLSHDSVLAHELGHQIDHKYGMQAVMKEDRYGAEHKTQVLAEMRALADMRFAGKDVTPNFKKYVREGSEKMAVMFEAYLSNKELFKDVAPHLYDDFRDFLASHAELKPFLDIKGGVSLSSATHGGEHVAGKNGNIFVAKGGKRYTITDATTKEIEQNTDLEYYHSAMASRLMQYVKLRQIDRANQFLESWKNSEDFKKIAIKSDEIPPDGWKMTNQVNFRNYYFEPRTAEVLDDMQKQMDSGNYNNAFTGINRILANAIFFNGLAHPINVLVTHTVNRGVSGLVYPPEVAAGIRAGIRALKAMSEKNEDYMELLRNGAHLMSSDVNNQKVAENLAQKLTDDLGSKPDLRDKLLRAMGYTLGQASFKTNIIYKLSHDMAWLSNDFLTMQSIFETMERRNMSMEDAIKETSRFIPDYRQKTRLLDKPLSAAGKVVGNQAAGGNTARFVAKSVVYNSTVSMFGSYHVGLMESLKNIVVDTAKGTDWTFSQESNTQRLKSGDKLLMLALLMGVAYPWLDKLARNTFGPTSYITRSGITKYPWLAYKVATGETSSSQAAQQIITPAVLVWEALQQFTDHDFFTGNPISGQGNEGRLNHALNAVAPFVEFQRVASGKATMAEFGATLLGVHTPKNTQIAYDLNTMLYDEKPKVLTQAKAHLAAGDEAGALSLVEDFNSRLVDSIKANDIAQNGATTQARIDYFFNQYGLKMPGQLAMNNYTAKQGQNIVEKTLPSGQPVVVKNTPVPATGVIGVITTYAKAIGTDPVEAFQLIFSGQSIRQVENGAIIVNRMSLAQSQANKAALAGGAIPKGMILDHIVPLEAGGTNDKSNLQLITTEQDGSNQNQPIEDFVGSQLKAGTMTAAQAREINIRFKAGQGQQLSPELLKEYNDKYGGKPLTLQDVYNYANTVAK